MSRVRRINEPLRVLACGSRTWTRRSLLEAVLFDIDHTDGIGTLITGGAAGADTLAAAWADRYMVTSTVYVADWRTHGKAAGVLRNQRMLDEGRPDLVVAFADKPIRQSRGTADMAARARSAGLPLIVVELTP